MILMCSCKHEAQDRFHGVGRRVHNITKSGVRCTVCLSEKGLSEKQMREIKGDK